MAKRGESSNDGKEKCPYCNGTGKEDWGDGDMRKCGACDGTGRL